MAFLTAYDTFRISQFDLNWFRLAYETEVMAPSVVEGFEDNYVIYTFTDDALVMAGSGFGYDGSGAPTIGTVEAFGRARQDWSGAWWDKYWIAGLDLPLADLVQAVVTASDDDDIALLRAAFSGKDVLRLSQGNDAVNGFGGRDTIHGHGGNDLIKGASGADRLHGGNGRDRIFGGNGDDLIRGGKGDDREHGGAGEDTFVFRTGDDAAMILDFDAKGAAHDLIDLSALGSVRSWRDLTRNHMERDGADVVIDGGNGDVIILKGVRLGDLDKGDFLF